MSNIKKTSFIRILALTLGVTLAATACDFTKTSSTTGDSESSNTPSTSEVSSSETPVTSSTITSNQPVSSSANNSSSSVSNSASKSSSSSSSSVIPVLTGIALNTENVKKEYNYGENLTLAGLVVTANYNNNTSKPVTNYTSSPANGAALNTVGEVNVVISYETFTESFKITVNKVLTGIELNTENVKKEYSYNENLDLTGLVVTAKYNDNSSAAVTDYTTNPANGAALTNLGENEITVTYNQKTASFKVNVSKVLTGIELDTTNVKKEYNYGEAFTAAGLVVYAKYNDNSKEAVTNYTVDIASGTMVRNQTAVTVTYETFTETYSLTVDKGSDYKDITNVKKDYYYGEALDITGVAYYVAFKDGTKKTCTITGSDPANGTVLTTIGRQEVRVGFVEPEGGRQFNIGYFINVQEIAETETAATLPLDGEITFKDGVANVKAVGTAGSDYHPNFKLTKHSSADDAMTVVNSKLRVKKDDVIENTESLGGVTSITVTGGNGNFRLLAGYTADDLYEFMSPESLNGDRIFNNVPNVNYIRLIGKYDQYPADIASISYTYTRNASHAVVEGASTPIESLTVNEGEYVKGTKTLVVEGSTVKVDGKTYGYTGIVYDGALFYADSDYGLLVKYVNNTAVVVRDTLNEYSQLSGQYTKVIPATKVTMLVNGHEVAANTADARVTMDVNGSFTFAATSNAVPAEEAVITLVDESNTENDPYIGTYTVRGKLYLQDYHTSDYLDTGVKPIVVTKEGGKYYMDYSDVAVGDYPGHTGKYECSVSETAITAHVDEYFTITINLEDKDIELGYYDLESYAFFMEGSVSYNFVSSSKPTAKFENGKVTALNAGNFYMSAKASNGLEARYYVKVNAYVPATLTVDATLEVKEGETCLIKASVNKDATDQTILFESADKKVATVDEKGLVTGVKAGETTITVLAADDEKTVTVTVKADAATAKKITYTFLDDESGDTHTLVVIENIEATIDDTIHFTYKGGAYRYDEYEHALFQLRNGGSTTYLDVIDDGEYVFGVSDCPVIIYDIDSGIELTFVSEEIVTLGGSTEVPFDFKGTYSFDDGYVEHELVIEEDGATLDSGYDFTLEDGKYVFSYDSNCYFTLTADENGVVTMHFVDPSMALYDYGAAFFQEESGDVELARN